MFVFCLGRCRPTIDLELVMRLRGETEGRCSFSTVAWCCVRVELIRVSFTGVSLG